MKNKILRFLAMGFASVLVINTIPLTVCADEADSQEVTEGEESASEQEEETIKIGTAEEFAAFAENCRLDSYSQGKSFELTADIVFTSGQECPVVPYFNGNFDGKGHTLYGINIHTEGSAYGLFRYVGILGAVSNLNVEGSVSLSGSAESAGGIVGVNFGLVEKCSFRGTVSAHENVGAICGTNRYSGTISDCTSTAVVVGVNSTGGIVGNNAGIVSGCSSESSVNRTDEAITTDFTSVDVSSLNAFQATMTRTNSGGIAGTSNGIIRKCTNNGIVGYEHIGYNVGGISGESGGRIEECVNNGQIYGRKDVGGIVGQLIPYEEAEYLQNTIDEISDSVNSIDRTLNNMSAAMTNITNTADGMVNHYYEDYDATNCCVDDQIKNIEANGGLTPEQKQYVDSIKEAQGKAEDALKNGGSQEDVDYAKEQWDIISANLTMLNNSVSALGNELGEIQTTVDETSSTIAEGNILKDNSSVENALTLDGVVMGCVNNGDIKADLNVGGVAGSVNLEYSDNPEYDIEINPGTAVKTSSMLNAVVMDCINYGDVTSKKNHAGGITGLSEVGLLYHCEGYGNVEAEAGNYAGGISGMNGSMIECCYVLCNVTAKSYVGGIAGSGYTVTNSVAMATLYASGEAVGSVLGIREEGGKVKQNYFSNSYNGAIDSICYEGGAQEISYEELKSMDGVPEGFSNVHICFVADGAVIQEMTVPYGTDLTQEDFPNIPVKAGYYATWPDVPEYQCVQANLKIEAEYHDYIQCVGSDVTQMNGKPMLLVTGKFSEDAALHLEPCSGTYIDHLVYAYTLDISGENFGVGEREIRMYAADSKNPVVLVSEDGASWTEAVTVEKGDYFAVKVPETVKAVALIDRPDNNYMNYYIVAGGAAAVLVTLLMAAAARRRKKSATSKAQEETDAETK